VLTREFFELLEYRLTKALAESADPELRRYWCDGVLESEWTEEYQPEYVAKSRRIILRAWMDESGARPKHSRGPRGQQLLPLHLVLGPASLKSYLKRQELGVWIAQEIDPTAVKLEASAKKLTFIIHLP
jgi:hypothetical protein